MEAINLNLNLSDSDKEILREAVREVIEESIFNFGKRQRESLTFRDTKETCRALSVSRPTLNLMREKGYIHGEKVGGKYLYSEDEIQKAVSQDLKWKR